MPVYAPGVQNVRTSQYWVFDRRDSGAFRVHMWRGSALDGLLVRICAGIYGEPSHHPYTVTLDANGISQVHHVSGLTQRRSLYTIPVNAMCWVWVTFENGHVRAGLGDTIGENEIVHNVVAGPTGSMLEGYTRFEIGKTANTSSFELVEVQPLVRNF